MTSRPLANGGADARASTDTIAAKWWAPLGEGGTPSCRRRDQRRTGPLQSTTASTGNGENVGPTRIAAAAEDFFRDAAGVTWLPVTGENDAVKRWCDPCDNEEAADAAVSG